MRIGIVIILCIFEYNGSAQSAVPYFPPSIMEMGKAYSVNSPSGIVRNVARCRGRGRGRGTCIMDPQSRQLALPTSLSPAWTSPNAGSIRDFGGPGHTYNHHPGCPSAVQDTRTEDSTFLTGWEHSSTGCQSQPQHWQQRSPSRGCSPHRNLVSTRRVSRYHFLPEAHRNSFGKESLLGDATRDPSGSQAPQDQRKDISTSQNIRSLPGHVSRAQPEQQQNEQDGAEDRVKKRSIFNDAMRGTSVNLETDFFSADPKSLTFQEIRALVRAVYRVAARNSEHAQFAADICVHLVTNDQSNMYSFTLLGVGRTWFEERDRLLPRCPPVESGPQTWAPEYHWTAYVTFIASLLSTLTKKARNSMDPSVPLWCYCHLAEILCECGEIMVQSVPYDVAAEVMCLRHVFTSVGSILASLSPTCMAVLARCIQKALRNPRLEEAAQSAFRDVPELAAFTWDYGAA
ncbi:hypothetical protein HPB50_024821 [Hyalomma asiaticum]|uniref:Uncharacterized protein n=1 Tax=Hyalomma asiaticum TaxID=266040 RepID=A0ACB7TLP3_HYAAI|nr:hypothetical protein HPB50_024821 [Hyalomma asiaticum]